MDEKDLFWCAVLTSELSIVEMNVVIIAPCLLFLRSSRRANQACIHFVHGSPADPGLPIPKNLRYVIESVTIRIMSLKSRCSSSSSNNKTRVDIHH
jgi:hypothetical protein